jgi:aspartyl/asparaginyl beta-hydroxylase (cupin superfamily)
MSHVFIGSNVANCTAAVVQQAVNIFSDALQIYTSFQDLSNKAAFITATCIPAGTTFVLAVPCVLLEAALVAGSVITDINTITTEVNDIRSKAPALRAEIQSCSAVVRNATTNVNNLLNTIETCVNNFVSSNP